MFVREVSKDVCTRGLEGTQDLEKEELKQLEKEIGETQELIKEGQRQSKEVDEEIVKKKDELANLDKEIKYMKSSLFWSKFI